MHLVLKLFLQTISTNIFLKTEIRTKILILILKTYPKTISLNSIQNVIIENIP